jgi:hypothetical protein
MALPTQSTILRARDERPTERRIEQTTNEEEKWFKKKELSGDRRGLGISKRIVQSLFFLSPGLIFDAHLIRIVMNNDVRTLTM